MFIHCLALWPCQAENSLRRVTSFCMKLLSSLGYILLERSSIAQQNSIFDKLCRLSLFLLEFLVLMQHFFGCNRLEIWPNSFNFDNSMLYSKFHTFLHLKAYGGALLSIEKICMSWYVLLCLSNILSILGSLCKKSWASHIIDLIAFLDRYGCKRTTY